MKVKSSSGTNFWNKDGLCQRVFSSQPSLETSKGLGTSVDIGGRAGKRKCTEEWGSKFNNSCRHAPQTLLSGASKIIRSPWLVCRRIFSGTMYINPFFVDFFFICGDFGSISIKFDCGGHFVRFTLICRVVRGYLVYSATPTSVRLWLALLALVIPCKFKMCSDFMFFFTTMVSNNVPVCDQLHLYRQATRVPLFSRVEAQSAQFSVSCQICLYVYV